MTISIKDFDGQIPQLEAHLLPHNASQYALNCDFSSQSLKPLNDGLLLATMVNNPVKGMYTEDGLLFYTWANETLTFRSPIVGDNYQRMYYLTLSEGILRVATKTGMAANGPSPATNFKAGVPRPTVAPGLKTVELSALPDYPNVTVSVTCWWNYNGTRYQQTSPVLTTVNAFREYSFPAPAYPASPPSGIPQLEVELKLLDANNSNAVLADIIARTGANGRSQGLPGGVEMQVTVDNSGSSSLKLFWGVAWTSAYTYTFTNIWGEESAPAPPATISRSYLQAVQIATTAADFTGYQAYSATNVYRTYGSAATYVQTSVSGAASPFTDSSTSPTSVGSSLQSSTWLAPPTGLQGMCTTVHGWLAAFAGQTLYMSESSRPHAWPYSMQMPSSVRGVLEIEGGLLVTCADGVYFGAGVVPSDVIAGMAPMNLPQPGIALRSMARVDSGAAYASNDGIPLVQGSQATMQASQKLFTRSTWRSMYGPVIDDASLRFAYFDGSLIATSNTRAIGFTIRLDENVGQFSQSNAQIDCMFQVPVNDALYYSIGANVYKYRAGAALSYDWWSRDVISTKEQSLGAGYIRCNGTATLLIYADGTLWDTMSLTTGFFRIAPILARRWSVRLQGTAQVFELKLARSFQELKNVE